MLAVVFYLGVLAVVVFLIMKGIKTHGHSEFHRKGQVAEAGSSATPPSQVGCQDPSSGEITASRRHHHHPEPRNPQPETLSPQFKTLNPPAETLQFYLLHSEPALAAFHLTSGSQTC